MEVEYYQAPSQSHYLPIFQLILIVSWLCGRNGAEWCRHLCTSTSSSSNETVDEYSSVVSKIKCRYNIEKRLDCFLATHTIGGCLAFCKSHTLIYIFQNGSYHSCRISLILPRMFANLFSLSISPSFWSPNAYRTCIQLITAIVFHPHQTLPHLLHHVW